MFLNKLCLLTLIGTFFVSCGSADGNRKAVKDRTQTGLQGLDVSEKVLYEKMKGEIASRLEKSNLLAPDLKDDSDQEKYTTTIEYSDEKFLKFATVINSTNFECIYGYTKASIESIVTQVTETSGDETNIKYFQSKKLTPESARFALPANATIKAACDQALASRGFSVSTEIDLLDSQDKFKNYLSNSLLGILNACENKTEVASLGKCRELTVSEMRRTEYPHHSNKMFAYQIKFNVETTQTNFDLEYYFSSNLMYLENGGLINMTGENPLDSNGIKKLDVNFTP